LFSVEEDWWQQTTAGTPLHDLGLPVLRAVLIAVVLFGAADRDQAITLLHQLPRLTRARSDVLSALVDWLRDLYPQASDGWLDPHLPARLAEYYTVSHLAATPPLQTAIAAMATGAGPARGERMLSVLAHAVTHTTIATSVFTAVLTTNSDLLSPAMRVALTGAGPIDHAIAVAIPTLPLTIDALKTLAANIPYPTVGLTHTAIAVGTAQLDLADTDEQRAPHLRNLGVRLSESGRPDEALTAASAAANIYRRLATANPDAYEPDLATSLNNLSAVLSELIVKCSPPPAGARHPISRPCLLTTSGRTVCRRTSQAR
jgi:hypothetical protein